MGRVIEVRGDACLAAAMNWCFVDSCQFFLGKSWGFIWLVIRTFGCSLLIYDMHRCINPLNFQLCDYVVAQPSLTSQRRHLGLVLLENVSW